MADVVLINIEDRDKATPFGILYIGSKLKRLGYSVRLFSFGMDFSHKFDDNTKKIFEEIKKEAKNSICVGFSVMTSQVPKSLFLSEQLKKEFPNLTIVWGGIHVKMLPDQVISHPLIDYAVTGEGEDTMTDLCKVLKKYKNEESKSVNSKQRMVITSNGQTVLESVNSQMMEELSGIADLVYVDEEGKIRKNEKRELVDFTNAPIPDWDLAGDFLSRNMDRFTIRGTYKSVEVHTGRGCPYRCSYCVNVLLYGKTWRPRKVRDIVDEIEYLKNKFGVELIRLRDENFFLSKNRVIEFCDELLNRNVNIIWETNTRTNYFDNFTHDDMVKLKKSGCHSLSFGAESGSPKVLDVIKKDHTTTQILNSARMCAKYDIIPVYSFMIGIPEETEEDILMTYDIIHKIKKITKNRVSFLGPHILRPYPGGDIYETCKELGFKEPEKLTDWDNFNPVAQYYVDPKELPWLNDPKMIDLIATYSPKGFNNYLSVDVPSLYKGIFTLRSNFFYYGTRAYLKTKSKAIRNILEKSFKLADKMTISGRKIAKILLRNKLRSF